MDVAMGLAVLLSVVVAVGMFFILPNVLTNLIKGWIYGPVTLSGSQQFLMNLVDGGIRLLIFVGYVLAVTLVKDIRRVFQYHGAEHKTINCYEHEEELTVEDIRKYRTLHPRCGTSYLLLVMVVSILLFSLLGWGGAWYVRIGLRLLMLPVVAGVAYEFLKFAAKSDNLFFRVIRWPGLMLQKLTTAQPDDSMIEVAIVAFCGDGRDERRGAGRSGEELRAAQSEEGGGSRRAAGNGDGGGNCGNLRGGRRGAVDEHGKGRLQDEAQP